VRLNTMNADRPASARTVPCPACGGPSLFAPGNPFRPFCSERCRQIDLGAWASEQFKLPEQQSDRDPGFEQA
jgi:endogenous inhibitor of DNA gyrase (YacG/DUF329 family)